jgi:hypothetical protein
VSNLEGASSVVEFEEDDKVNSGLKRTIANITVHFKRPFRSDNLGEDVAIEEEVPLGLLLSVEWGTNLRSTGTSLMISNPIASWEVVSLKSV